jgi:hypothetical protein
MSGVNNSVLAESLYFVENGAGTYTGTVVLPAGATLIDVIVHAEALWAAGTSAALIVGDTVDDNGIFDAVDLKATDLLAGESISVNGLAGGQHGADLALDYTSVATIGASQIKRRYLGTERTMQAKVTSVGAGTTGRTRVTFVYAMPQGTTITQ